MKTIITKGLALALVLTIGLITNSIAQQDGFTYQGAVRNADGSIIADQALPVRISILSGTASGTLVWQETHNPNTNVLGIFTIVIGNGSKTGGTATQFADINWASAAHFIKTEVNFGSGFTEMSNVQLFSVPYALVAKKADEVINKPSYAFDELSDINLTGLQSGDIIRHNGTEWTVAQLPPSTVTTSGAISGNGSANDPIKLDQQGAQQGQTLKWNGTAWVPSNDNGLPERMVLNVDNSSDNAPAIKTRVGGARSSKGQVIEMNADSSGTGLYINSVGPGKNIGLHSKASGGTENLAGLFEGDVKVTGRLIVDGESMMQNDMLYLGNPGLTTWQAVKDSSNNYIGAQINFGGIDSANTVGAGGGSLGTKFWEINNPESGYLHINTKGGTRASLEGVTNQIGEFATLTLSSTLGLRSRLTHAGLSLVNDANNRTMLTAFSSPAGGNIYVRSGFSNQVVGWFGTHQNSGFTQLVGHNADSTFSGAILSGFWTGQPTLYIEDGAEIPHFIADIEVSDTINYGTRGRIRLGNSQNQFGAEIYGDGNANFSGTVNVGELLVNGQPLSGGGMSNHAFITNENVEKDTIVYYNVSADSPTRGLLFEMTGPGSKMAIRGNANSIEGDAGNRWGVVGSVVGNGSGNHTGVLGQGWGKGLSNSGVVGTSGGTGNGATGYGTGSYNNGVIGQAFNNTWGNSGVYGLASGTVGVDNIGVVGVSRVGDSTATTIANAGLLGRAEGPGVNKGVVGMASGGAQNWAGWFEGNVRSTAIIGALDRIEIVNQEGRSAVNMFAFGTNLSGGFSVQDSLDNSVIFMDGRDGSARFNGGVTVTSLNGNKAISLDGGSGVISVKQTSNQDFNAAEMYEQDDYGMLVINDANNSNAIILDGGSGTITATTVNQTSDARYKTNITTLSGSLSNVLKMRGVSYNWLDKSKSQKLQIGLIAQEVETIYPEFVHTDDKGMKSVNYAQMTAVLIEAIKELNAQVESLKNENASLKANAERISQLEANMQNLMKMMQNSNPSSTVSTPNDK